MKKRKKILSLLLCAALLIGLVPFTAQEAQATVTEPSTTQFATAEQLKGFNTNDNDGAINPAKVYFGNSSHQWWIAGVEGSNLVLFAASPLARGKQFKDNYEQGTYEGYNVNQNHYGASSLRKTTLKGLETSYFTSEEQKLMNTTTVSTRNTAETGEKIYYTTDKLYLADSDSDGPSYTYVTVGASNNLRIDKTYWGNDIFWLRAPIDDYGDIALVAGPGTSVVSGNVDLYNSVVPAFNFNLSSVIFASAAKAASSDGKLTEETVNNPNSGGAFTLRHKSSTDIGDAKTGKGNVCVSISNVSTNPAVNTYLVAQNSEGAWAKKVSNDDIIFADEVDSSLTSFDKCKVWLETTNSTTRITSAEMATSLTTQSSHNVKVKCGDHMSITNGNGRQTGVNGQIGEITVTADSGYYFPTNYSVEDVNGISVSKTGDTTLTISGTPTADTLISLPAAKAHEHSWTYELKSGNADTIEATCNGAGACTLNNKSGGSVKLNPPQNNITYDGNAKEATLTNSFAEGLNLPANADIDITYAKKKQGNTYENIIGNPKDAGDYKASITLSSGGNTKTAYVDFTINKATLTEVSVKQTGALIYNNREQTAEVEAKATAVNNQPVTFTYSASEGGNYTKNVPAFKEAIEHTVYYKATAPNHEEAKGSFKITITPHSNHEDKDNDNKCDACKRGLAVITDGKNAKWIKGSKEDLVITSAADFEDFEEVQVGGQDIAQANYEVKKGSTIVTLKADYLESLPLGEHEISIVSDVGTAKTTFTIEKSSDIAGGSGDNTGGTAGGNQSQGNNNNQDNSSQTGDESNPALWIALMLIALAGASGTAIYSRKKKAK